MGFAAIAKCHQAVSGSFFCPSEGTLRRTRGSEVNIELTHLVWSFPIAQRSLGSHLGPCASTRPMAGQMRSRPRQRPYVDWSVLQIHCGEIWHVSEAREKLKRSYQDMASPGQSRDAEQDPSRTVLLAGTIFEADVSAESARWA